MIALIILVLSCFPSMFKDPLNFFGQYTQLSEECQMGIWRKQLNYLKALVPPELLLFIIPTLLFQMSDISQTIQNTIFYFS